VIISELGLHSGPPNVERKKYSSTGMSPVHRDVFKNTSVNGLKIRVDSILDSRGDLLELERQNEPTIKMDLKSDFIYLICR